MDFLKHNKAVRVLTAVIFTGLALLGLQTMSSSWIRARGDQLLKEEKFDAAERWFQTSGKIDPQNWQAQFGLGRIYFRRRYYELDPALKHEWALKEQAAYAAAYRINSKKEEVRYGLARIELFLGNRDQGLDLLRSLAVYARFDAFYWRKLGIELRKAGLYDEALKTFEYALTLDRSNATVKRNIDWLKKRVGTEK
jgi:tetratricopeptide (TPR) repeat protein